tara:strand:+ start:4438 stop:5247 length:810 start_codon:yes stop_codon:yes gene_type:complete
LFIFIITFLITGLFSGLIAGLLGVGGGIIIVPISYFVLLKLGYSINVVMHVSIASSLCIIIFTSISSIRTHLKLNNVDKDVVKKWYLGIILGSILGSFLANSIKGEVLVTIFVSLAFLISINMFFQQKIITVKNNIPKSLFYNYLISGLIGFLSAIIGIGGGSFSVPTLSFFSKKIHRAVGTSAVLGFFIAFPGTISYIFLGHNVDGLPPYSLGYVNILIVVLVASTSIFTANFGAKLSSKIETSILKKIFAIFLLFTCISLVIEHFVI